MNLAVSAARAVSPVRARSAMSALKRPKHSGIKATPSKGMSQEQLERLLATEIEEALSFIHSSDLIASQRLLLHATARCPARSPRLPRGR